MANLFTKLENNAAGLRCSAASDVGMRRSSNQDSMAVALANSSTQWQRRGHLLLVADGMGAHAAGELASQMATDSIPHSYQRQAELSASEAIEKSVQLANAEIHCKGETSIDFRGMGTTCSCLLLLPSGAMAAHVGDSRVYRLRRDQFEQLTFDHSLVWEMAAAGDATEEEVPSFVPKNVITRSLGPHPQVTVDLEGPFPMQTGDRYLLCSDGLTGPLHPETIGMVLGVLPPDEAVQTLVDLANLLGGPDNITVVVAEVVDARELRDIDSGRVPQSEVGEEAKARPKTGGGLSALVGLIAVAASVLLGLMGRLVPAIGCGAVAAIAFLVALVKRRDCGCESGEMQPEIRRGNAPYRQYCCTPGAKNISTLTETVQQLEELENKRDWDFDWQPIHEDRQRAHEAIQDSDYSAAVVAYCSAVRRLMKSVRKSHLAEPSDSSVDLA